jgi:hypothetical protein
MKLTLLICSMMALTVEISYGQQYYGTYGKPLIVLKETDPWSMVIGSDVPSFALYEKGQIIYRNFESGKLKFHEVTLTQKELQKVIQSFEISEDVYKLENLYTASTWTDQPDNILTLNLTQPKTIIVYGRLTTNEEIRKETPKEFLRIYDNIKKYRNQAEKEWLPEKIEIMFWDYKNAPAERTWIKGFPDLNSPATVKSGNGIYSVFIGRNLYKEFVKYFSSMGNREAVLINGRKMAMSYRFPFPNIK